MKALIVLNLEDCTFDEIDEAEIKEISLIYQDKETGKKYDFLWETGFKIVPMPKKLDRHCPVRDEYQEGYNRCIEAILGEEDE